MKKIKVLERTPFDKEGDLLTVQEFLSKYAYSVGAGVSFPEIINWIERERKLYLEEIIDKLRNGEFDDRGSRIGYWFEVVEEQKTFPFGGREIQIVKKSGEGDGYFLFEPRSQQYFSVFDIHQWFLNFKWFLNGFKAYRNDGSCMTAQTDVMFFIQKDKPESFGINFTPRNDELLVAPTSWEYVRKHIQHFSPEMEIRILVGDISGNINELFDILEYVSNLTPPQENNIPIHKYL